MRHQSLAARYADALFALTEGRGALERVDGELAEIASLLRDHPDLANFWGSPLVAAEDQKAIASQLLGGKADPMLLNTLLLMFDNKRGAAIEALHQAFRSRFNDFRRRLTVKVRAAMPLDDTETLKLREQLAKSTAREIEMDVQVDSELIGGLVVKVGDQVIDSSLKGRLEALARTLS